MHEHVDNFLDFDAGLFEVFVFGVEFFDDFLVEFVILIVLGGLGFMDDLFDVVPDVFLDILYLKSDYAYVYSDGVVQEGVKFVSFGEGEEAFLNLIFFVVKSLASVINIGDYVG